MKSLLLMCIFSLVLTCCKQRTAIEVVATAELSSELPSDFLQFYMKFQSDSLFQLDRIAFPIAAKNDSTLWTKENWVTHRPFDDHGGQFKQSFNSMGGMILEHIYDDTGYFTAEKKFMKSSNGYQLFYYRADNAFEGSAEWESSESN